MGRAAINNSHTIDSQMSLFPSLTCQTFLQLHNNKYACRETATECETTFPSGRSRDSIRVVPRSQEMNQLGSGGVAGEYF